MYSNNKSKDNSTQSPKSIPVILFSLAILYSLASALPCFASESNKHNIWVIGAPGAGKSALISSAITKLAAPEVFSKLGRLSPESLDNFGEQAAEDRHYFDSFGKSILEQASFSIGNIDTNRQLSTSDFSVNLKFSPVEVYTNSRSSILHATKYPNQYTHRQTGYSFIDTPGLQSNNASNIADAMRFSALTNKDKLKGSINQIVALLQVDQQMIEDIQQEAASSSWMGYFGQGLRRTLYYNNFERQVANIINAIGGVVKLKEHGAPLQVVLVPSADLLEDFSKIKELDHILNSDPSFKVNLANKISKFGLPVEGNQLLTALANWTSIYESPIDLSEAKFSFYAKNIDQVISKILNNKNLNLAFKAGSKLESAQKAIAAADVKLVNELPEKTRKYERDADELKANLLSLETSLNDELEGIAALQKRDVELSKERTRFPNFSIISSSEAKDKQASRPVNFRFASVSQFRDAAYHVDFLFFGKNPEGDYGVFFEMDTISRRITKDIPPLPKKVNTSVNRIGQAEALSHTLEFVDKKNSNNTRKVRFELLAKDLKSIEKNELLSGILADEFKGYMPLHARGNGHTIFSYGTPREFSLDVYADQGSKEIEYKRLNPSQLEKIVSDINNKKRSIDKTIDSVADSKDEYSAVSRQKDAIVSDYNSYLSGLKRGGVPNVEAYLKELGKESGSIKDAYDRFSEVNKNNQLSRNFVKVVGIKRRLEQEIDHLEKRFDPVLPESQTHEQESMVFVNPNDLPEDLLSDLSRESLAQIFDAFESGVLTSRVEDGEYIYSSTEAEVLACLVNMIFLPRYQIDTKIVGDKGSSAAFRRSHNFDLDESNEDRWQASADQQALSKGINIAVFGPRGSGKTTFLNTANHFASTLDKSVEETIEEAHGMGYPGLPLSAWANRGFKHSWTHKYFGTKEFTVGKLRAQLPTLTSDSKEYVSICQDPTCSAVNMHQHKYLRSNPGQKESTDRNGEVIDSFDTVKVGMIPHYHLRSLDVRGFELHDQVFNQQDGGKSNPLIRAMLENKDFKTLDGLVLVLNATKIINDDENSSYKRATKNQLLAINEIRINKETGAVRPLHVIFTHFLDKVKYGESVDPSSSEGESSYLSDLRNKLLTHLKNLMVTNKENISTYFLDQEFLWSSQSIPNKNRFIHYKTAAHEVVRLFENVENDSWDIELDQFREGFGSALKEKRVELKYATGALDSIIAAYNKEEGDQGEHALDGGWINHKDKNDIEERQAGALQFIQVGLDNHQNVAIAERGNTPMHYFLREKEPDQVWWNHHKSQFRTPGRVKLAQNVVADIKKLKSKDSLTDSTTGRDIFVIRSLGKTGKLRGEYCWSKPNKRYEITDVTLVHKVLEEMKREDLVDDDIAPMFERALDEATRYRHSSPQYNSKALNDKEFGGDLQMLAIFARNFDNKTKKRSFKLVHVMVKKSSELSGKIDISKWLY